MNDKFFGDKILHGSASNGPMPISLSDLSAITCLRLVVYHHIAIQIAQLYVFDLLASGVIVTKAVSGHDAII